MEAVPIEIKRSAEKGLDIRWSDGEVSHLSSPTLRNGCPCAGCREQRNELNHSRPLDAKPKKSPLLKVVEHTAEESLRLVRVWPVGQYAIGIEWGDGHATGIYTFPVLRELAGRAAQTR